MSGLCGRTMCTLSFSQRGRQPEEVTGSPSGTQKIPGSNIRGFLIICARYWVRTSEGKNFPSARGTNKSFPRRGRQPEEVTGSPPGTQKIPGSNIRGFLIICARYWDRTSDLFRVREARSRCANRPCEVGTGFEPVYTALQAVASPLGQPTVRTETTFDPPSG